MGKLTVAQTVKHSPLINGTFGLKLDGSSLNKGNISYDVSSSAKLIQVLTSISNISIVVKYVGFALWI